MSGHWGSSVPSTPGFPPLPGFAVKESSPSTIIHINLQHESEVILNFSNYTDQRKSEQSFRGQGRPPPLMTTVHGDCARPRSRSPVRVIDGANGGGGALHSGPPPVHFGSGGAGTHYFRQPVSEIGQSGMAALGVAEKMGIESSASNHNDAAILHSGVDH
jgi:hypothetical protein